jgi:predicted CxxxxCH...CXXCH cytochrome family protein
MMKVVRTGVLLSLLFTAYLVPGIVEAASTCTDCHGMPPLDGAYRNISTGAFRGNHQTHLPAAAVPNACAVCHAGSDKYTTGHLDRVVQMTANVNSSPVAATYSKGVFFNATSAPVLGSCSSVNCHFEAATPTWGNAKLTSPAGCNACHDAPPRDGNHPTATGSGKKHGDYFGTTVSSCMKCHPDHSVEAFPFAHATSAGKRSLSVLFTGTNAGGSYSGTLTYPAYLPSQSPARNGTCSGLYCHSNGSGAAPRVAAVWGSSLPADCTGCHGGDSSTANPITTGKHPAHMNNAAVLGSNFGCAECHAKSVSANATVSSPANHVNGFKDYSGRRAGGSSRYNATAKTCSIVYCHSNGKGGYVNPPAWNSTAVLGCNGCHGTTTTTGVPDYSTGNTHGKHVLTSADCDTCHSGTTATGTAIKGGSALHINGVGDVIFDPARAGTSAAYNATAKSCSTTSCHGASSPVWGATLPTDCTGCHGGTASSSKPMASNAHPTHLTAAYGPGGYLGGAVSSCQVCHIYSTTQPEAHHANGAVDIITGSGSACAGCHPGSVPAWNVSTRLACTVCHSATPAVLPNGVAAPYKANFTSKGHGQFPAAAQCASCHDANSGHISGAVGDAVRLYGANDNTVCSGCHSGSVARAMATHVLDKNATPTPSLCKSCHDVHGTGNLHMIRSVINGSTIVFTSMSTGFVKTAAPYDGLCQVCHTKTNYFRKGDATSIGHNNNRNCLNCHSHTGAYAFQPAANCDSCHGYPPAPAGFAGTMGNWSSARTDDYAGGAGAHLIAAHIKKGARPSEGWANCTLCHGNGSVNPATHTMSMPVTPSKVTIDVDDRYKFNPGVPLSPAQYNGVLKDGGTNSTGSCSNTACHYRPSKKWSTVQ